MNRVEQSSPEIEVAVIGAGPIGIETAIALKEEGIEALLIEAKQIGHSISQWPRDTRFFSPPERIALAGVPVQNRDQFSITGDEYLPYLRMLVEQFDLRLHNYEPAARIEPVKSGFLLHTRPHNGERVYHCRYVVAATGGTAGSRKLDIPGETLPHVFHRFPGPHPFFRTRLLIVGGRNSAIEAALRCWRAGAHVAISYRRSAFDPDVLKPHLLHDIQTRIERGEITFLPATIPVEIRRDHVLLRQADDEKPGQGPCTKVASDFVLLALGFMADTSLLAEAGVQIIAETNAPVHDPDTMETNIPGIFVAGTAVGGTQWRLEHAIYTSHNHVAKIVRVISGRTPRRLGSVEGRNSDVDRE